MAADLVIAPEVGQDLADAYAWYADRRIGLGEEFLSCVDACIEAVFYEYAEGAVTVYGVFHASRDPNRWRRRLP